jgi:hypothetical protein
VANWIALFEGYEAQPTSEGVSLATTRTVVDTSLAVLGLGFPANRPDVRSLVIMRQKNLELAVGLFIALGLAAFLMLAIKVSDLAASAKRRATASPPISKISAASRPARPVTLGGVRIGRVVGIGLDSRRVTKRWSRCPSIPSTIACRRTPAPAF